MSSDPKERGSELDQARAELGRLEAKLAKITDPDIRSVLTLRIQQVRSEHPQVDTVSETAEAAKVDPVETQPEPEEPLPPAPTKAQLDEVERLLRQANVERVRGNAKAVTEIVEQAAKAAPGAYTALEALGDDQMARKKYGEALITYVRALKVSPKNMALERKHAEAVFRTRSVISVEEQMRMVMGESLFMSPDDSVAGKNAAIFLNVFIPGTGQLYLGYTKKGAILLGIWLVCLISIILMHKDMARGNAKGLTMVDLIPMLISAIVYVVALTDLRGKAHPRHVDRPRPPVDLPFD